MTTRLTRRGLFRGTSAAALGSVLLPWDLAQAQSPGGTLRVGMTASAVPLSNGCPDQGAEGHRFMGSRAPFRARNFDEYAAGLKANFVVLDAAERKARIIADAATRDMK